MKEKLDAISVEIVENNDNAYLLQRTDGTQFVVRLSCPNAQNVVCWVDKQGDVKEITYDCDGFLYSLNLLDKRKNGSKTSFTNKNLRNPETSLSIATNLEELSPLREDFVRLKHRCLSGDVGRILKNGLIFNHKAAGKEGGNSYRHITEIASCYENGNDFWKSIETDDFSGFDNARQADVQVLIDLPREEFDFLQQYGCLVYGRADCKYIVGVIPNFNGGNKDFILDVATVKKAKKAAEKNPLLEIDINDMSKLQEEIRLRRQIKMEQVSII